MGLIGFYKKVFWLLLSFKGDLLGFTGFYLVLLGFSWVLLVFFEY